MDDVPDSEYRRQHASDPLDDSFGPFRELEKRLPGCDDCQYFFCG
jgi:hypothetical protein